MSPGKAALDAHTDQLLAKARDLRAAPPPEVARVLPVAAKLAARMREQFPGQEETVARVMVTATGYLAQIGIWMGEKDVPVEVALPMLANIFGLTAGDLNEGVQGGGLPVVACLVGRGGCHRGADDRGPVAGVRGALGAGAGCAADGGDQARPCQAGAAGQGAGTGLGVDRAS